MRMRPARARPVRAAVTVVFPIDRRPLFVQLGRSLFRDHNLGRPHDVRRASSTGGSRNIHRTDASDRSAASGSSGIARSPNCFSSTGLAECPALRRKLQTAAAVDTAGADHLADRAVVPGIDRRRQHIPGPAGRPRGGLQSGCADESGLRAQHEFEQTGRAARPPDSVDPRRWKPDRGRRPTCFGTARLRETTADRNELSFTQRSPAWEGRRGLPSVCPNHSPGQTGQPNAKRLTKLA